MKLANNRLYYDCTSACGILLTRTGVLWKPTKKFRPQCAEVVKAAAVVCKHCGHNFVSKREGTVIDRAADKMPAATQKKVGIGCGVITVVAAIAIIAAFSGNDLGNKAPASTGAPAAPAETTPQTKDAQKADLLKLLANVTAPLAACGHANDTVLTEIKRLRGGQSDQLTVYSAAQAAISVCDNSADGAGQFKAPQSLADDERNAIDKTISDVCPMYPRLISAAWGSFSKMINENDHSLSHEYEMKQAADAASMGKIQCIGPIIGRLSELGASEKEVDKADNGI